MDELEIDGKKYLSSKRAAREHKYHIDYIGQLIRAGKVSGKKVGRSWYVEEASLKSYLLAEAGAPAPIPVEHPAEEPAIEPEPIAAAEPAHQPIMPVEASKIEPDMHRQVVEEKPIAQMHAYAQTHEETVERAVHFSMPVQQKPSTLTYVEDDEPMLPVLKRTNADFVAVPMRKISRETTPAEEPEAEIEAPVAQEESVVVTAAPRKIRNSFASRAQVLTAIAVVVFAIAAVASSMLASSISVTDGGTASVGFTIK